MRVKFQRKYFAGILVGILILVFDFYLYSNVESMKRYVIPIGVIGFVIGFLQFFIDLFKEFGRQKEMEDQFLEFNRNLVASINSGIPIPRAILNVGNADYKSLSPYIRKLAYQIEWGIPINEALKTFAGDTGNKIISRSMSIIIEAEESSRLEELFFLLGT